MAIRDASHRRDEAVLADQHEGGVDRAVLLLRTPRDDRRAGLEVGSCPGHEAHQRGLRIAGAAQSVSRARLILAGFAIRNAPRRKPRQPARDIRAIGRVLRAICGFKRRFFIDQNKQMERERHRRAIDQQDCIAQQQRLTENNRRDCKIHRVADMAAKSGDDEPFRGIDRSRRANAFAGKTPKRIKQDRNADRDQNRAPAIASGRN